MALYLFLGPGLCLAAGVVFPVVGAILVALRIKLKIKKSKGLGIEDWLVFPALAFMIGMGIVTIIGVASKSEGYTTPPKSEEAYKAYTATKIEQVFWNTEWMQPLALGCIKLSFIFFYRRIFNVGPNKSIFNIVSIVSIVLMIVWMLGFFLSVMLLCPGHVSAYWGLSAGRAKYCWQTTKFLYALCWSDVGTDLIVLVMPIPSVLKLHLPNRKKLAVIGIFALGALTVAASITRAVFYLRLLGAEKTVLFTLDPNMLNTNGIYWMLMETGLGLIAVNLPLLYGTVRHEGVESVIRSVRSFASIVSTGSRNSSKQSTKASTAHKRSRSSEGGESIELVPAVYASNAQAGRSESINDVDVETGNINVTKSYTVDQRK